LSATSPFFANSTLYYSLAATLWIHFKDLLDFFSTICYDLLASWQDAKTAPQQKEFEESL
jgi:hypothetical protein